MYFEVTLVKKGDVYYTTSSSDVKSEDCKVIFDLLNTKFYAEDIWGGPNWGDNEEYSRWFSVEIEDDITIDGEPYIPYKDDYFDYDDAGDIACLINDKCKELGLEYVISWNFVDEETEITPAIEEVFNELKKQGLMDEDEDFYPFHCCFLSDGWFYKNEFDIWGDCKDKPLLSLDTDFKLE